MFPWGNNLFPFNQNMKDLMESVYPKEIDTYVKNVIDKSFQRFSPTLPFNDESFNKAFDFFKNENQTHEQSATKENSLHHRVFETHDDVYIRIPIQDKSFLEHIKIFHTSNKSMIEGFPKPDDKHEIILPAIVKKKGAQATYKDGLLEIKIPKNIDMQFTEIDVQEK